MKNLAIMWLALALGGCASPAPLKGGKATTLSKPTQGIEQTVVQSENPSQISRQDQETVRTRIYTVPTGSRLEESRISATGAGAVVTNVQTVVVGDPMPVVEREETRAKTELGAAQKDTARELGAKLASLKGIVWVGVTMFLLGLASIFYPPLKALIGSVTTSAAIAAGGLALIVLPTLIVGNELLILGGVGLSVGGWFLAHRHGRLRGFVDATRMAWMIGWKNWGSEALICGSNVFVDVFVFVRQVSGSSPSGRDEVEKGKKRIKTNVYRVKRGRKQRKLERAKGFEPSTFTLAT